MKQLIGLNSNEFLLDCGDGGFRGPCECLARLGRKCAKPSHVAALCQKCHNTLDAPARRINAAATLATKLDGQRGLLKLAGGAR